MPDRFQPVEWTCGPALRAAVVLAALAILAGWQTRTSATAQSFPQWGNLKPGPHAVGFKAIHAVDSARSYGNTITPGPRPIRITLWYPATPARDARPMQYRDYIFQRQTRLGDKVLTAAEEASTIAALASSLRQMQSLVNGTLVPVFPDGLPEDRVARMAATPTAAFKDAAPARGRFPVVLSIVEPDDQSILFEYLASQGYVVATVVNLGTSPAFPGSSDPDRARREETKSADLEFLSAFVKKLDHVNATKVAALGSGVGLAPAVRLQSVSEQLNLLVGYNAPNAPSAQEITRLRIPMLFILVDDQPPAALDAQDRSIDSLIYAERYILRFKGVGHPDLSGYRRAGNPEQAGSDTPFEAAAIYVHKFLDAHFGGDADAKSFLRRPAAANGFDPNLVRTHAIAAVGRPQF